MNDERTESQRRLLNDVLRDDVHARPAALGAFRRARFLRRAARVSVMVVTAVAITAGILSLRDAATNRQVMAHNDPRAPIPQPATHTNRDLPKLTDEQLIASFPPNSCFLAEVDGRKVLVFTDPQVEAQVRGFASPNTGL